MAEESQTYKTPSWKISHRKPNLKTCGSTSQTHQSLLSWVGQLCSSKSEPIKVLMIRCGW